MMTITCPSVFDVQMSDSEQSDVKAETEPKKGPTFAIRLPKNENEAWIMKIIGMMGDGATEDELRNIVEVQLECAVSKGELEGIARWRCVLLSLTDILHKLWEEGKIVAYK